MALILISVALVIAVNIIYAFSNEYTTIGGGRARAPTRKNKNITSW